MTDALPVPTIRVYECADCVVGFGDRQTLMQHITQAHLAAAKALAELDDTNSLEATSDSLEEGEEDDDDDDDDYEIGEDPANSSSRNRHHCRYCSKSFHRSFCLKRHERRHTGEKPFKCQECGKRFSDRSNLLQHERSRHSEAKTYVCTACLKQFAQYNYLRRHLRSVHRNKLSFICPEPCNHAFVTEQTWMQHLRTHRNNVKPITVNGPWPFKGSKTKIPGFPDFPTATRKETAGGYRQNPEDSGDLLLVRPVAMKAYGNQTAVELLSQVPTATAADAPTDAATVPQQSQPQQDQHQPAGDWAPSDQGTFNAMPDEHFHASNGKVDLPVALNLASQDSTPAESNTAVKVETASTPVILPAIPAVGSVPTGDLPTESTSAS